MFKCEHSIILITHPQYTQIKLTWIELLEV